MSNKLLDESDAGYLGTIQTSKWRQKGSMSEHDGSKLYFPKELWQKCFALTPVVAERTEDFDQLPPPILYLYVSNTCATPKLIRKNVLNWAACSIYPNKDTIITYV